MGRECCRAVVIALLFGSAAGGGPVTLVAQNTRTIADFDGERTESESGLAIWPFTDEQFGGTSECRVALVHPGAAGSRGALRISFHVTSDFPAPFAGAWAMVGAEGQATDLSAYQGIRFRARSRDRAAFSAGIVRFPGQLKRYAAPFEVGPDWTIVELPFRTFRFVPAPGGAADESPLDAKDITSIGISVAAPHRGDFELDLDRLEVYR